jgi:geranylgeranyl pyrophosphate synthase
MDERKRSPAEELDYQLATRYFASAFEHFDRLPADDQQSLLREISNQISKRQAAAALRGE